MKDYIWAIVLVIFSIVIVYYLSMDFTDKGTKSSICGIHDHISSCCATGKFNPYSKPIQNRCGGL